MFYSDDTGIFLSELESNSEWDVVSTGWNTIVDILGTNVSFELKLRRKPLYVILVIILPICMLALLNICVFILPCESGEKASYAITVFLAFVVFMTIVTATLPENSENLAVFSIFLIIQTISSTLITITALILIRFHAKQDDDRVPKTLSNFLRCFCRKHRKVDTSDKDSIEENNGAGINIQFITWKEAIGIIDRVCFLFFFLVLLLSAIITFSVAAANGQ